MEKQKEYNLRYLLAKVRKTRKKASDMFRQRANKTQQRPRRPSYDIGAELGNHTVGRGPMEDRKGLILRARERVRFIGISKPTRSNERKW
jgi:hypothetical protein